MPAQQPGEAPLCARCNQHRDATIHHGPHKFVPSHFDFHPYTTATKVLVTFTKQVCDDNIDADLSYLRQRYEDIPDPVKRARCIRRDQARLAAFNRGEWHMLGIRAVAKIEIHRPDYIVHYEMESPGLWGIESDSQESYFDEVFREECNTLKHDIEAIVAGPITWPAS